MLLLTSTSDKIQIITGTAVTVDVHASYVDHSAGVVTPGRLNTKISTATTTDVVLAPAASTQRNVRTLHVQNVHASSAVLVTVQHTDGTNVIVLEALTLLAGERFAYVDNGWGFQLFDANGIPKTALNCSTGNASLTDQVVGAADAYLAGSSLNIGGRLQAGSVFRWHLRVSKSGAGTVAPLWSIRFGTAGTTGDTQRVLFTGPAQTAVVDQAFVWIEAVVRTVGASGVLQGAFVMNHNLAITGFATTGPVGQAHVVTTSGTFDTAVANSIIGLSVNPGTSASWTFQAVTLDAINLIS